MRVFEGGHQFVAFPFDAAAAMVEMQVGEEDVGDIIAVVPQGGERFVKRIVAVEMVMTEEFRILLVADAIVDEDEPVAVFHQHAAHRPGAHVIVVGRVEFVPDAFGHYAEHGAAVELEEAGIDRV